MLQLNVTLDYCYYLRRTKNILTKATYFNKLKHLKILHNNHLMFVRAPKHFKSGKQHIVFFGGLWRKKLVFHNNNLNFIFTNNQHVLFNLFATYSSPIINEMVLQRITFNIKLKKKLFIVTNKKF